MMETTYVTCESNGYNANYCYVPGYVMSMNVVDQRSFAACEYGTSYGFQANSIWVARGCRATFVVGFRR